MRTSAVPVGAGLVALVPSPRGATAAEPVQPAPATALPDRLPGSSPLLPVVTPDLQSADVILVNTCGFIDAAKQESIDAILGAAKLKEDGVKAVVAVGCLVQRHKQELQKEIP